MRREPNSNRPNPAKRMHTAAAVARSGARRYPSVLADSLRRLSLGHEPLLLDHAAAAPPLAAVWLGHATVLIRLGERWVLTDPVFSERIGVRVGPLTLGVGRMTPPVDLRTLPPIDLILLSHAHFDHLDKPTLRRLVSNATRVVTARHTSCLIPRGFANIHELHWNEELELGPLSIRALQPDHWGARTAWDTHRGYNSYLLSTTGTHGRRVLFAGDTAFTHAYSALGGVDLSIFGIGAYEPWIHAHANPEQVWHMHRMAGGRFLLPMHHSTFKLSDEPFSEPMERLLTAAREQEHLVISRRVGEVWRERSTDAPDISDAR